MRYEVKIQSVSELDSKVAPGMLRLWKDIKGRTGSKQVRPKWLRVTDQSERVIANDYDLARRFMVDLTTMTILDEVGLCTGECAINSRGEERAISDIPVNVAVVTFVWCDYYRYNSLTLEVNPASLPKQLMENTQAVIA